MWLTTVSFLDADGEKCLSRMFVPWRVRALERSLEVHGWPTRRIRGSWSDAMPLA